MGAGDDYIEIVGASNSIAGGTGDDVIYNYNEETSTASNVYIFTEENFGNDTIWNFRSGDKIVLGAGTTYEIKTTQVNYGTEEEPNSGSQVTITVKKNGTETGTITLESVIDKFDAASNIEGALFETDAQGNYLIKSVKDLQAISDFPNAEFKLAADITVDNFTPINNFTGTFDGSEHLIISNSAIFSNVSGKVNGYIYGATDSKLTSVYKINLPTGTKASGALTIDDDVYAAADKTVTISNFTSGNITFDSGATITSDGDNVKVTIGDKNFTLSGLSLCTRVNISVKLRRARN